MEVRKKKMEMRWKKEIVKTIKSMSWRYSEYKIFSDWVKCAAISLSNAMDMVHGRVWMQRERDYIAVMQKYESEERKRFSDLTGMLVLALEEEMSDILGAVYMESGAGSKAMGQFFTPFHIAMVCAEALPDSVSPEHPARIVEPSCGGGGMIIAAARVLKERGVNYETSIKAVAQDLDWKAVYMCYLQCSFLGIDAVVVQGSTLKEPYCEETTESSHVLYTPRRMGVLV